MCKSIFFKLEVLVTAVSILFCGILQLRRYDEAIRQCEQSLYFAEKNFASLSTGANMGGSECESYSSVRLWRWCLISRCYFHLGRLEAALDLLQKLEKVGSIKDKYYTIFMKQSLFFHLPILIMTFLTFTGFMEVSDANFNHVGMDSRIWNCQFH